MFLIYDTETTGLSPSDGSVVVEVGAILFDVELRDVVAQISFLMPTLVNEAEHVNRISPDLSGKGIPVMSPMMRAFYAMVHEADYVVAHNAEFDSQWFGSEGRLPASGRQSRPGWSGQAGRLAGNRASASCSGEDPAKTNCFLDLLCSFVLALPAIESSLKL